MSTFPSNTPTLVPFVPYSADELAGFLQRDESVNIDRLAATVYNLLVRTDRWLEAEQEAADETAEVEAVNEGTETSVPTSAASTGKKAAKK